MTDSTGDVEMKRGILIDSVAKTIEEVQVQDGLQGMYDLIQCTTVDAINVCDEIDVWVDDDGMYTHDSGGFSMRVGKNIIQVHGRGLLLGLDLSEGSSISLPNWLEVKHVEQAVRFVHIGEVEEVA